jgi:hypothetical protein
MTALAGWQNFYVIVGSSAGALIGLQFVVMALIAGMPRAAGAAQAGSAFATPTVVHFASVLLLSAALCAPWHDIDGAALLWGLMGLSGIAYEIVVARRMQVQTAYRPVLEDWLFHALLPFAAYSMLAIAAFAARNHVRVALFGVGLAALALLFIGIHNAWDAVTYHIFERGLVASMAANELALDQTWKGKEEKTKFTLNSETKKEGNIAKGDRVVVYYRFENGERIATELRAIQNNSKMETKKS